jgi:glycosyltransferase involved in cell wall biosynthesis
VKTVLYVESAPQAGGSTISLFQLLQHLDRQTFEPLVLLCASNPYAEQIASLGIRVLLTDKYCSLRTPAYPSALMQARASTWADRLRSHRLSRAVWRAGGLAVRSMTQTWPLAQEVRHQIRQHKVDLVHLNDAPSLHKAGILGSRMAGVPCICHVRSMPPLDALDRLLLHFVTHFIFISKAVEDDQRRQGIGWRPGTVVYNALDLSPYRSPDRQAARQAFGLAENDVVVGMMGRIEPWKGHRDLLAALSILAPQFPRLRCLIAGRPELDGMWYQQELVSLVASLQLDDVVRFVGYQRDVPQFLAALDVLVHASVQPEPFGRVLIEGMAAGLPIVATKAGGVPEVVADGETGVLVPPGEPPALAAAIAHLLSAPEQARAMGERGRERASALFAIGCHVDAITAIYSNILHLR